MIPAFHPVSTAIISPAKSVRTIALSGRAPFAMNDWTVQDAVAVIEVSGMRTRGRVAVLRVGFSAVAPHRPCAFAMTHDEAVGTMVLHTQWLEAYLFVSSLEPLFLRIGGDGAINALSNSRTCLALRQS